VKTAPLPKKIKSSPVSVTLYNYLIAILAVPGSDLILWTYFVRKLFFKTIH